MSTLTQIHRLRRTDSPKQHLLVHVSQTRSNSLDLKLIGTEHEHLYHGSIKESNIKSLQASNYSGDLDQWKDIIRYAFLHQRPAIETSSSDALEGVETVAAISKKTLTITLRKNIGGITQRLGSVELAQNDEKEEVSPFEWVDTAVSNADDLRSQLGALQASVSGQQGQVANLSKQLDDLVQAKKDHEAELLRKFSALLNTKKLKIRDQQRLLNGAKVDPAAAEPTGSARDGTSEKGRKAKGSRGGKRKAAEVEADPDEDMEDEGAHEAMEDYEEERRDKETPPRTEDEATDDDDLDAPAPPPPRSQTGTGNGKGKANGDVAMEADHELPPRRELPFQKTSAPAAKPPAAAVPVDEDDDETDDEL